MSIQLTLPDGSERRYEDGTTGYDVAASIGTGLARAAVAVTIDGETLDLNRPIDRDGAFSVITENTDEGRAVLRHSAATPGKSVNPEATNCCCTNPLTLQSITAS